MKKNGKPLINATTGSANASTINTVSQSQSPEGNVVIVKGCRICLISA